MLFHKHLIVFFSPFSQPEDKVFLAEGVVVIRDAVYVDDLVKVYIWTATDLNA